MSFTPQDVAEIVSRVMDELSSIKTSDNRATAARPASASSGDRGVFSDVDSAVGAARKAFDAWQHVSLNVRGKAIDAIRAICMENLHSLARTAFEETGLGRYEDKVNKNLLVIEKTPGIEDLQPVAYSGDFGLTLAECAPYGVIGAITPTTNPTETIINNAIGMIAAGNAVVFNAHPRAKKCCAYTVDLINQAVMSVGGPANLACIIKDPTMESGNALMNHPGIRILVVTGGPGIVKAAFQSGKKVIAAGPGNPPAVVDETADLDEAAKNIIAGATLDNNILCIAEKEIFVVQSVADAFIAALKRHGGYQVIGSNIARLEKHIFHDNHFDADLIGQNADKILKGIGIDAPASIRMAFIETDKNHFLVQKEQMMPVLPVVRCPDVATAIAWAVEAEKGNFHTATMHSRHLDHLHAMAVASNCSIFVKNGPSYAGLGMHGEGFATMSISSPTGEGLTSARSFTRSRRCVLKGHFRIV